MDPFGWKLLLPWLLFLAAASPASAQHIHYKDPGFAVVRNFPDTSQRLFLKKIDSNNTVKKQFAYLLRFYPKMRYSRIIVEYRKSPLVAKTVPRFSSIFKLPHQRVYRIVFSDDTGSTLDSVIVKNLSFNSQLGLIANQLSIMEDMSTGGFFNFIGHYVRRLTERGRTRINKDAELKTLEMGLGYQLLSLNRECAENLKIENWTNTKRYSYYIRHYRNQFMRPDKIINFINDLPVYVSNAYK